MEKRSDISQDNSLQLDKSSFEELYRLYAAKMYRICFRDTRDEYASANIVHNVFLSIWERRETLILQRPEHFLLHATKIQIIKFYKVSSNQQQHIKNSLQDYNEADFSTQKMVYYRDLSERIHQLVSKLPKQSRKVYQMRDQQGLNNDEIAFQLGISVSAVKQHIGKALSYLRANLER